MKLSNVLSGVEVLETSGFTDDIEITGLAYDSRRIQPGDLFFAVKGYKTDGHKYIDDALQKGCAAVVQEDKWNDRAEGYRVRTADCRTAMALSACNFYHHPSKDLLLCGITGTDGKTSACHILRHILNHRGKTGIIGTVGNIFENRISKAVRTTPEAVDINRTLREMADEGAASVVMEVSSHALALKRVEELDFDIAVFTNLAHDHLDFHSDMEDYFQAKLQLFKNLKPAACAVINIDDPYGKRILKDVQAKKYCFSMQDEGADLYYEILESDIMGNLMRYRFSGKELTIRVPLIGFPGASNSAAAVSAAHCAGCEAEEIVKKLVSFSGVKGRFQRIDCGGFTAFTDYAHTPQALERLLQTVKPLTAGKLHLVFGCGGDRDKAKRPLMGAAAEKAADMVYITSDNPRSENPAEIINEILKGIKERNRVLTIPDRRDAIIEAMNRCEKGDTVIIAGKGHEDYQEINGVFYHFDDCEIIEEWLGRSGACPPTNCAGG